ncbi:MAG: dihydrodipicolinate synthase family protein [Bryobacteraceae bacterium]
MHLPAPLRGIVPPLVTPLTAPDNLDGSGLHKLVERLIQAGCSAVFVLGTTGEAQALSYRLRLEVVRETCRSANGAIPVLAGVSDTSVVESIRFGEAAAEAGAAALVTSTPFYFRMGQSDLLRHIEMLARELPLPLFLYNMPGLTKLWYEPETVAAAAGIQGVAGVKDSSGDLIYLQRVLRLVADKPNFTVFIGPEELLAQALSLGAHGGIPGGANLRPELYVELFRAASTGCLKETLRLQHRIMDLSERIYRVGDPATSYVRGLKCALGLQGICSDLPGAPLVPFTTEERALIGAHLNALSISSFSAW